MDNLKSEQQEGTDIWAISGYLSIPVAIVAVCAVIMVMGGIAQDIIFFLPESHGRLLGYRSSCQAWDFS